MKQISVQQITETVRRLCIEANVLLPDDVRRALDKAAQTEKGATARGVLADIIENYQRAERLEMPICQDTGTACVFVELGQQVEIVGGLLSDAINEGVAQGYIDGYLRKSVVHEPLFDRNNTGDNTPAVIHTEIVPGDKLRIMVVPKGAGSENMGAMKMLKPADGLEGAKQFILDTVRNAGGNPCPPIVVGIGVGGTMEKAPMLAKKALTREIGSRNENELYAALEEELLAEINKTGIGPQGLGGRVTALAVHIEYYPTHIAMLPVAVNINCHAARHKEVVL